MCSATKKECSGNVVNVKWNVRIEENVQSSSNVEQCKAEYSEHGQVFVDITEGGFPLPPSE